ncbi:uncharacterized protein LOC128217926 isoform X2 [Mya arenaria]|uniref:uncharacterized protein LOC128217926 isoform X2 n=1 Tax=Mya arenaria TaxID=6604 RepID=UPI0022E16E51|nr:uncharacterized protein LOC128217926 isoform X2 [Mya arenaria]
MKTSAVLVLSVMFHFDCIRVQQSANVFMVLANSPQPIQGAAYSSITANISINEPTTHPSIQIGYKTAPGTIQVSWAPLIPHANYSICLMEQRNEQNYICLKREYRVGVTSITFVNVPGGRYTILIGTNLTQHSDQWETVAFNVSDPTPPPSAQSNQNVIVIATISCLVVVMVTTALIYCFRRNRTVPIPVWRKIFPCCCNQYHAPPTAPNNVQEIDMSGQVQELEIKPLYVPVSKEYQDAIESVCMYLQTWAHCSINWQSLGSFDSLLSQLETVSTNVVFVIFLHKGFDKFMNNESISHQEPAYEKFQRLLVKIKGKEFRKIIVSFDKDSCQDLSPLSGTQHVRLVPDISSFTTDLNTLLAAICSKPKPGWFQNSECSNMVSKISSYIVSSLFLGKCQGHCVQNCTAPRSTNCELACNEDIGNFKSLPAYHSKEFKDLRVKEWTEEQNRQKLAQLACTTHDLEEEDEMDSASQCIRSEALDLDPSHLDWQAPVTDEEALSVTTTNIEKAVERININYDKT